MSSTGVRIQGGINLVGENSEVQNLELEELAIDPTNADAGRMYLNTTELRVAYAEGVAGSPTVTRYVANLNDISELASTLASSTAPIETIPVTNSGTNTILFGQPVYSTGLLTVDLAVANDPNMKTVIGFASTNEIAANGGSGTILSDGQLSGTIEQWAIVTNNQAGLIPNTNYFLDIVTGCITPNPPTGDGQYLCPVGRAISATSFIIRISPTIQL